MSGIDERLREALKNFTRQPASTLPATITAVDRNEWTVDVEALDGSGEIFNVRLRAALDGSDKGLVIFPKVGSTVLVATVAGNWNSAYVAMVSEIDELSTIIGTITLQLLSNGIKLNGDEFGGLVKISPLVDRLNRLERRMTTHQHFWGPPNAPVLTVVDPTTNATLTPTVRADLENPKVKHG